MEKTVVCISCYYKGYDFMDECKKLGNKVILITSENLKDKSWPWHAIDEIYYMPELAPSVWNLDHLVQGFAYLMKNHQIDAVIALDDYDVEKAAMIRETYRIPGMGQTTQRYFRDKLAMRQQAKDCGISVPEFSSIFNDAKLHQFTQDVPAPWVLKPRSEASATGIKKINSADELWTAVEHLGNDRYKYLLESFKPGDVYHVDCLVYNKEIVFSCFSKYLAPPMKVSHEGGVFRTKTLDKKSEEAMGLEKINREVLAKFGIRNGATHSEYIRGTDGQYYFLETSSRGGGAHIPDMVEAATGVNIWREWAKLENALLDGKKYTVEESRKLFAGLIVALAKEKHPDTSQLKNEDVEKFLSIDYHIGIVYKATTSEKVQQRLDEAAAIIIEKILNILPPKDKPTS
ncbi:acetyl-CoA carboxylase biotin carboxylase subunit family protein [Chryseobacterium sp. SC28]|uniref:ATP-grasp domain-containing protein n=1 Tax=Chryseobacterium sp. SC28 TaxID=2268028 RepID=UPI000F64E59D|nr:ATP-grasp domain-containing protein [Chryseobacterium sp. SC28]RRQ46649.1 ATP-grasp domain-containing protein [Chryseobacterium sp. SC28]